ncbi:MAG: DsbA family protein [Oscillospiraceae bacterium]|jgi:predicted DsbA family dithiol-disulfide isomerase|nr:DsbA family protein [Oscillospiraceae bacterium]
MTKIEFFIDYTCPYCEKGFALYEQLRAKFPQADSLTELIPIEAHPRDEEPYHRPYADLTAIGALYLKDQGLNIDGYSRSLFAAIHKDKRDPEDIAALAECALASGADAAAFEAALTNGEFAHLLRGANGRAYNDCSVWAVPTLVCGDVRLDSTEGAGITFSQLEAFLQNVTDRAAES